MVASCLSIADAVNHSPTLEGASAICHALFYFWAAGNLMVYMLADRDVTTDELYAVGATFTLVAWGFAYVYAIAQLVQPGCFIAAVNPEWAADVDGAAVPQLHQADQHRAVRRRPDHGGTPGQCR